MSLGWLLGPLAASWEALGASWQPLGGLLAPLGGLLGASWRLLGPLGVSWRPLGTAWWPLRGLLEPLGGLLGASWGGLWLILAPLERSLAGLGVALGPLGRKSGPGCSGSTILGAPKGGSLAEKWPWLEREHDFQGSPKSTRPFDPAAGALVWGGAGPP